MEGGWLVLVSFFFVLSSHISLHYRLDTCPFLDYTMVDTAVVTLLFSKSSLHHYPFTFMSYSYCQIQSISFIRRHYQTQMPAYDARSMTRQAI
ncbi:hypothetical protein B0T09DRAFT_339942 [Sordaria sp. MPI-SDFR-AT-0083]|nr:hypothetical protein B0T09DRAFT_339942 [Sordaria sp. MPI-SDFR-AT-0083]